MGYGETVKGRKANDLTAAETNEDGVAFTQTQANHATTNEHGVAFAQTRSTNDGNFPVHCKSGGTRRLQKDG